MEEMGSCNHLPAACLSVLLTFPAGPPAGLLQVPTRYGDRNGGYCRVKAEIQPRRGDNTEMATIELV